MSCHDLLKEALPEIRPEMLEKLESEGLKRGQDLLLCDKNDLRLVGFNIMECNRIALWKDQNGTEFPPKPKEEGKGQGQLTTTATTRDESRSRSGRGRSRGSRSPPRRSQRSRSRDRRPDDIDTEAERFVEREISPRSQGNVHSRLLDLPADKARDVMSRDLSTARNRTAVVLTRIKEHEQGRAPRGPGTGGGGGGGGGIPPPRSGRENLPMSQHGGARPSQGGGGSQRSGGDLQRMHTRAIQDFVDKWRLEDAAEDALLSMHPVGAQRVMSGPCLSSARNPTAVTLARCKEALRQLRDMPPPADFFGGGGGKRRSRSRSDSRRRGGRRDRSRSRSGRRQNRGRSVSSDLNDEIDTFVRKFIARDAYDRVIRELRGMHPDTSRKVMDRDLSTARNATAVVLQRMNEIRAAQPADDFLRFHNVNDDGRRALEDLNPDQRAWVMAKDLSTARDPTAVVLARCNEAHRGIPASQMIRVEGRRDERDRSKSRGSESNEDIRIVKLSRESVSAIVGIDFADGSLEIQKILPDTAADRCGLEPGWKVLEVNGEKVRSLKDAQKIVSREVSFTLRIERCR